MSLAALSPLLQQHSNETAVQRWAEKDRLEAASQDKKQDKGKFLNELSHLLMTLTKSALSNPLQTASPAETAKLLQGVVDIQMQKARGDETLQMANAMREANFLHAANLVGKNVSIESEQFHGESDTLSYEVPRNVSLKAVSIELFPQDGSPSLQFLGNKDSGRHTLSTEQKEELTDQAYFVEVRGLDEKDNVIPLSSFVSSPVEAIDQENTQLMVKTSSMSVPLSQIQKVY